MHLYVTPDTLEGACVNVLGDVFDEDAQLALIEVSLSPDDFPPPDDEFDWAVFEPIPASALRVLNHDLLSETSLDFLRSGTAVAGR